MIEFKQQGQSRALSQLTVPLEENPTEPVPIRKLSD